MLRDRDALVQVTHDTLMSVLEANSWARLNNHVQEEKHGMKIHSEVHP
jgi:hypothetical protein